MHKRFDDIFSALMFAAAVAVILAGGWCLSHSIDLVGEEAPPPAAEVHIERPTPAPQPAQTQTVEAAQNPDPAPSAVQSPVLFDEAIPLSPYLQSVLYEVCAENGIPVSLALGLIEVESNFDPYADNGRCYGLLQLNKKYFPDKLSPADNIRYGIRHLGDLLEQYGDVEAALVAYNAGYDTGYRGYANAVLSAAERWQE